METKNLKFLGAITGVYNTEHNEEAAVFNILSNLLVFVAEDKSIKVKYKELIYDNLNGQPVTSVNEGEFWLQEDELTSEVIAANFNERAIKKLIFAEFYDYTDRYYNFMEIY